MLGSGSFVVLQMADSGSFVVLQMAGSGSFVVLQMVGSGSFVVLQMAGSGSFVVLQMLGSGSFVVLQMVDSGSFVVLLTSLLLISAWEWVLLLLLLTFSPIFTGRFDHLKTSNILKRTLFVFHSLTGCNVLRVLGLFVRSTLVNLLPVLGSYTTTHFTFFLRPPVLFITKLSISPLSLPVSPVYLYLHNLGHIRGTI